MNDLDRRRATAFVLAGVVVPLVIAYFGVQALVGDRPVARPARVIVGEAGGVIMTPGPSPLPTSVPTSVPTPVPTPVPSAVPTPPPTDRPAPEPTIEPTAVPSAAPTAEPPAAAPQPTDAEVTSTPPPASAAAPSTSPVPASPPPAAVAVTAGPADAVAAFYRRVSEGSFDAAYALWSDRMKAAYPRSTNLDGRFAETASVTFTELRVASQSPEAATVQANFVERYDGGGSREFVGYWRLVLVDGAWLLDEPTY